MAKHEQQPWFPAKRYGWGWGPPTRWQGWVVMLAYLLAVLSGPIWMSGASYLLYAAALTVALLAVCWWKGEKPRWRWGDEER